MADPRKVRWSQLKVGVVGLAAFLILAVLIFLLTSSKGFFQKTATLRTFMDDASGLAEGTPVRLNGFTIGSLDKIQLIAGSEPKRSVEFIMVVQEKFLRQIPVDSVASISAANLLGDKFLNITKGRAAETVKNGAEIKSLQAQDIPELMAQSANLLQTFQSIVNRLDSLLAGVEAGKGNIGKLLKDEELYNRLNGIAIEGQNLLTDVRKVPHKRAHQRVVLAPQFGIVKIDEPQRAVPGLRQLTRKRFACHNSPCANWVIAKM